MASTVCSKSDCTEPDLSPEVLQAFKLTDYYPLSDEPLCGQDMSQSYFDAELNNSQSSQNPDENTRHYTNLDATLFDSQPISNQQFFPLLDEKLFNMPKDMYVDTLRSETNDCEETINMYRSIQAKRARYIASCPEGTLITRKTTKLASCAARYANDCFCLQQFVYNGDAREVSDVFIKKKAKSEPNTDESHQPGLLSLTLQMVDMKSAITNLQQGVKCLETQRAEDCITIANLKKEVSDLKSEINKPHAVTRAPAESPERVPSLFKNTASNTLSDLNASNERQKQTINSIHATGHFDKTFANAVKQNANPALPSNTTSGRGPSKPNTTTSNTKVTVQHSGIEHKSQCPKTPETNKHGSTSVNNPLDPLVFSETSVRYKRLQTTDESRQNETTEPSGNKPTTNQNSEIRQKQHPQHNIPTHVTNRYNNKTQAPEYKHPQENQRTENYNHINTEHQQSAYISQEPVFDSVPNTNTPSTDNEDAVFECVGSTRTRRYYVGGIALSSNRAGLVKFLKDRNITPVGVRMINTNRGSQAAKITINVSHGYLVEDKSFWPRKFYCRRWYGENHWNSKFYTSNGQQSADVE